MLQGMYSFTCGLMRVRNGSREREGFWVESSVSSLLNQFVFLQVYIIHNIFILVLEISYNFRFFSAKIKTRLDKLFIYPL